MTNRIELRVERTRSFADGFEFANRGAYERIDARALFAVDPAAPAQAGIVDLDLAPRNSDGLVEFGGEVCILRPVDPARGNRRLLFGYVNRGNKRLLQFLNDAPASNDPISPAHAGNGFLMRRGYTLAWSAWEGDLLPGGGRMLLDVPVARAGSEPVTGTVRIEFVANEQGVQSFPLSGNASARSYPTVSRDTRKARLTRRRYQYSDRQVLPPDAWSFARMEMGFGMDSLDPEEAVVPSDRYLFIADGFEPGWIYELVYTARDPLVLGLGHVAVRDLVSFLRYEDRDAAGNANPLGDIEKAYAFGRSQTGRCIRDFIHAGYNADVEGRRVFDGVMPHVSGGGLMWMNHRFASVVSPVGHEYEDHFSPADRFPFSYAVSTDHLSGEADGILKRPDTDPLVIHTQTPTEYWQRRGSLVHTDTRGNDLAQPDSVRIYLWSSSQHFADPNATEPSRGIRQQYVNVVATSLLFRAMLDALDRWATNGDPPPESRIPTRAEGTLIAMEEWRAQFPAIPGVATPRGPNSLPKMDFGPDFAKGLLTKQPPELGGSYVLGVPSVDGDGNEIPGVRAPMVRAPLGTYTGWNLRGRGYGYGAMFEFSGSYVPFPDTLDEREASGDPRASIMERYGDAEGYRVSIETAARALVEEGFMLEEDVPGAIERATDWGRPLHFTRL